MSTSATSLPPVTVFAPDGTQGQIPAANVGAAIAAGGKVGVHIYAPDGTPGYIPHDQLPAAIKAGAKFSALQSQSDEPQAGILNSGMRFLSNAAGSVVDAGKGMYHAVADPPQGKTENIASVASPVGLAAYRSLVAPSINTYKQGAQMLNDARDSGDVGQGIRGLGHVIASAIPGLGPAIVGTSDQMLPDIENGNYAGAAGTAVGNAGLAYLLGKAGKAITPEAAVPGENYTHTQLKAHTGILGRMNGLGDNFIPQDSASSTGSVIRQAAADNPAITAAAKAKGSTTENIAAFQRILQEANTSLEAPHANTIAQHAAVPADVSDVQAAVGRSFPSTLNGVSPEDAAAIDRLKGRLGTINTLGGLNDLRQWLNDEAAAGYKQDGVAAARGTATKAGIRAAANAARNAYYDQLQQASGVDFRPIKAQQSALLDQQEGAAKLGQTLSAQQAVADEPKSATARAGDALTGGRALKAGPIAGTAQLLAEKLLGQKPLTQPNYLIRKFLSELPAPTQQSPPPIEAVPTNSAQLPANATPPTVQGTTPPMPPIPPTLSPSPQGLLNNPQGNLPSGSLQSLLQRSAHNLQLPADTNGMAVSQTQSSSYPALNEATAVNRTVPAQYSAAPQPAPNLTRPVTPTGEVLTPLQRFLQAGDLEKSIQNPSTDDLKRAIAGMRKRRGQ